VYADCFPSGQPRAADQDALSNTDIPAHSFTDAETIGHCVP
jgi:hypothetical protein